MTPFPFKRVQAQLAELVNSLPAESQLPTEPLLAKELGVSRATLREVMRAFESQGLIRRRQGVGTFVVGKVPILESGLEVLESIETLAQRIGLSVSAGALQVEHLSADEEYARALDLPLKSSLTRVSRVIYTDHRPVAYLVDVLPGDILAVTDIDSEFSGSVLDILLQRGSPRLSTSRTEIRAENATPEVARALQVQRGDVLLHFVAYLYSHAGRIVDYSSSHFLPGYFRFHVVRRVV